VLPDGIELRVKVQPRARRPGVHGLAADGASLAVSVAEPPEDGRANGAVCVAIAEALGRPVSALQVVRGATARRKTIRIAGDPAAILAKLEPLLA
jgi:uncharacterized protein (TIGR00251 family)